MIDEASWGGDSEMSAWEGLMWRAETDPRTRSTGILLEILESEPEADRFWNALERCVSRFPRLRDRVVEPALPLGQPLWTPDPEFDLRAHVQTLRLSAPADQRTLLDMCEHLLTRPLDRKRAPWEAVLFTGLEDGRAALAFKFHHSLTDGIGLVQLLAMAHEPAWGDSSVNDGRLAVVTPGSLLRKRVLDLASEAPRRAAETPSRLLNRVGRAARDPIGAATDGVRFGRSLGRMLAPPEIRRSPLLSGSGVRSRLMVLDVPLDELRAGGRAAGGSVNDAFVAGILGGLRRFHEAFGVEVDTLPLGMPVSLRKESDPLGGNRFAGVRIAAPLSEPDPAERIRLIREIVLSARDEPAIGFLDHLSPVLTKLPSAAIIELSANLTSLSDVQVSNIRGLSQPVELAGVRVLGTYPLGPRPGVAMMVALMTYDGNCCLGLNVDPDVFDDLALLVRCLRAGFAEVTALATAKVDQSRGGQS
jgi:WS/DGAT/MGAT family acyltransferase